MNDIPKDVKVQYNAALLLADGTLFFGKGFGKKGTTLGEICFNTAMTGYQEILTDLSYAGQIVCFTFPHIGNVGTNLEDIESQDPACKGLVVREPVSYPSNFRSRAHFEDWLDEHGITGISGVDTRALTQHIRNAGAQNALICFREENEEFDFAALQKKLAAHPSLEGLDLAKEVSTTQQYKWAQRRWEITRGYADGECNGMHVVAIDYGEKLNILRSLVETGCKVTVMPASATAEEILKVKPDGIFLSNGPADPAATGQHAVPVLRKLIASGTPIFGICLGHQLLALALGAETEKMHQGHRGANHPVKNLKTGQIEITSQNHGFVVAHGSLPPEVETTHISLFDGTIEGLRLKGKPVFSVQYHPESSPGPHDSLYLFDEFVEMMRRAA
jgi:carbamoyl-phosphate synthase small subunit